MNVPEIRFKGFEGGWKAPKIKEIFELRNGYTPSKAVKEYWENGTIPWFRMEDIRAKGNVLSEAFQYISRTAVRGEGLFKENSIILATTATIGVHAKIIAGSLANQQFTNFSIRKSLSFSYISDFVNYAFYKIDEWCVENTNSGGLLSVDIKSLLKQPFYTPDVKEQKRIASYFLSLESNIKDSEKKLSSLQQTKAACLQSMFPKEGETVPKVRFKGYEGEWNEIKLEDIVYLSGIKNRDNLALESYSISNELGFVPQDEQFENGGTMANADKTMYYIVSPNSFAYNPARINIGSIGYYEGKKNVIVSSLYVIFKTNQDLCDDHFLFILLKSESFNRNINMLQEGGVRLYFFYDKLIQSKLKLPSKAEQQKIASFFHSLDKKISLETQRLEKLKQIKSACLDKMFV